MANLFRRMLGTSESDSATPVGDTTDWARQARFLGLRDAALSGFYRTADAEVFRGIPIGPDDVVVDVGCGEGAALAFCARLDATVIAIDHHPDTLEAAKATLAGQGNGPREFHQAAAEDLPLPDGAATRVLCMEVLEHVADPGQAVAELARIGRPGALYLITVPDPRGEALQQVMAPDSYFQPPNHIRIFERDEFEELVRGAGLEILSHEYYGFYWALWYALFWSRGVEIEDPDDPVLEHWTKAWSALLDSDNGAEIKGKLDTFLAKSQVIVARKPE